MSKSIIEIEDSQLQKEARWEDVEKIILNTYNELFDKDKKEPSISRVFDEIKYKFETEAYDIIYGISAEDITEEMIMVCLTKKGCVFTWCGTVCCEAQQVMFGEIYEQLEGDFISYNNNIIGLHE